LFGPLKKRKENIISFPFFLFWGLFAFYFNRTAGGLGTSSFVSRSYTARKKYKNNENCKWDEK
jgi:hypothetical protein